jgi:hypothetical protein
MRYGLNTKRLRRTLYNVVFDIDRFLAAVAVDFSDQAEYLREPDQRLFHGLIGDQLSSACTETHNQ